ncbi:MAG: ABC transporter permease [Nitrospirae bacterium]|nr:ABC transporter permease [Nitrospirota bacterium]
MKRHWFLFFFKKSVSLRKGRILIASASVTLAVAVITGMLGITLGIRDKLGAELKAYGANIIVTPVKGDYLEFGDIGRIAKMAQVEEATGQIFGTTQTGGRVLEVIGLDVTKIKSQGWKLTGNWPEKDGAALLGVNIKEMLALGEKRRITLSSEGSDHEFEVAGFIEKGGPEDSAVILQLDDAWRLLGRKNGLSAILVRGKSGSLEHVVSGLKQMLPEASVKTLRQVAFAEASLLSKIQLLMVLVTIVVLFAASVSVASTMGANVLERRSEIGLMKALGATRADIGMFYQAESVLIGLLGGATGFALGFLSAQIVSRGAFASFISVPYYLPVISLAAGLAISVAAGYFPVRDAMKYNPAIILRGE